MRNPILTLASIALAAAAAARAQTPVPVDGEFQVNSYTTDFQIQPAVAANAEGDFVVVWQSSGSDGSDPFRSIQGQLFGSTGATLGVQFQVNTFTTGSQEYPSAAMDADGDFVVVWESDGSGGGDTSSIHGQRYASDGATLGGQFLVNPYTTGEQVSPSVAASSEGDFVAVWPNVVGPGYETSNSVQAQSWDSGGQPAGGPIQVNSSPRAGSSARPWRCMRTVASSSCGRATRDAGLVAIPPAQVGDRVWLDTNANGVQDGGENGVEGVTVNLYRDLATLEATDVTDTNGFFSFSVDAGTYFLEFVCSSDSFTALDSSDDAVDSDVEPTTGTTSPFTLAAGAADGTRDAGLLDGDGDGVSCSDNCPADANADQADSDGDGVGDACDLCQGDDATGDADNDGLCADRDCDDGDSANACLVFSDGFESGNTAAWPFRVP